MRWTGSTSGATPRAVTSLGSNGTVATAIVPHVTFASDCHRRSIRRGVRCRSPTGVLTRRSWYIIAALRQWGADFAFVPSTSPAGIRGRFRAMLCSRHFFRLLPHTPCASRSLWNERSPRTRAFSQRCSHRTWRMPSTCPPSRLLSLSCVWVAALPCSTSCLQTLSHTALASATSSKRVRSSSLPARRVVLLLSALALLSFIAMERQNPSTHLRRNAPNPDSKVGCVVCMASLRAHVRLRLLFCPHTPTSARPSFWERLRKPTRMLVPGSSRCLPSSGLFLRLRAVRCCVALSS
mmetsp:Transcript_37956/g.94315  ORF Transcript_37956/g.94315 Transcript_37956/m.94315 type:complete len:294 (+) Transcript_37956:489-1370(+)